MTIHTYFPCFPCLVAVVSKQKYNCTHYRNLYTQVNFYRLNCVSHLVRVGRVTNATHFNFANNLFQPDSHISEWSVAVPQAVKPASHSMCECVFSLFHARHTYVISPSDSPILIFYGNGRIGRHMCSQQP